jgi:hypothetical protein
MRSGLQLDPRTQHRLLDLLLDTARRAVRPRRPILQPLATTVPIDPLRPRLAGAADDRGRGRDRHPRPDKTDKPSPLTLTERGTTMQLH